MDIYIKEQNGFVFAFQLMPEAKLLVETYQNKNHQPFESNYVSFSVGLGIIMLFSLIYGLLTKVNQRRGGRCQGF
jgi:hypothetical protein